MNAQSRAMVKVVGWIGICMVIIVVFHLGGSFAHVVGQFSPLTGALIGGSLTVLSAVWPRGRREQSEPWIGMEQLSWLLVGLGILLWAMGEMCWRYFVAMGQSPFPSIADLGYSTFPLLAFAGLLLQPSPEVRSRRMVLLLDCLISMGSIFAIAWYLLLGSLSQAPGEASLAKFLGIYYPTADLALLSCVVFLLLRGQGGVYQARARRVSLLFVGLGLCCFVFSDFLFNVQNNAGTYVEATWIDLGWPLGLMLVGVAAHMRRFLPATALREKQHDEQQGTGLFLNPLSFVPYVLLGLLMLTLTVDVLLPGTEEAAIRPVLLFSTLGVIGLVVLRQILAIHDNGILAQQQAEALEDLALANRRVEMQAREIADHSAELERGIAHLKDVQATLANGNLHARANLTSGVLLPLAGSLNIMAERLMRLGEAHAYTRRLTRALNDLCLAFERSRTGTPLIVPESCNDLVEMQHLLTALRVKKSPESRPAVFPDGARSSIVAAAPSTVPTPPTMPMTPRAPMPSLTPAAELPRTLSQLHNKTPRAPMPSLTPAAAMSAPSTGPRPYRENSVHDFRESESSRPFPAASHRTSRSVPMQTEPLSDLSGVGHD